MTSFRRQTHCRWGKRPWRWRRRRGIMEGEGRRVARARCPSPSCCAEGPRLWVGATARSVVPKPPARPCLSRLSIPPSQHHDSPAPSASSAAAARQLRGIGMPSPCTLAYCVSDGTATACPIPAAHLYSPLGRGMPKILWKYRKKWDEATSPATATDVLLNGHRCTSNTSLCMYGVKRGTGGYIPRQRRKKSSTGAGWKCGRLRSIPRAGGHRASDTAGRGEPPPTKHCLQPARGAIRAGCSPPCSDEGEMHKEERKRKGVEL